MKKTRDEDTPVITEEEQERLDELDAQCRQIFDPVEKTFDDRKRRVTDLKECSRVTLPKPLKEKDEALIEIRRGVMGQIYQNYRDANCKKDEKQSNLSKNEIDGLESLQKTIQKKEIMILKTDKRKSFVQSAKKFTERWGQFIPAKKRLLDRRM